MIIINKLANYQKIINYKLMQNKQLKENLWKPRKKKIPQEINPG